MRYIIILLLLLSCGMEKDDIINVRCDMYDVTFYWEEPYMPLNWNYVVFLSVNDSDFVRYNVEVDKLEITLELNPCNKNVVKIKSYSNGIFQGLKKLCWGLCK